MVGIVFGGKSEEHEVSIITTISVLKEIDYNQYHVLPIYIDKLGKWHNSMSAITERPANELTFETLEKKLNPLPPNLFELSEVIDVFFPLVHGTNGEDGTLQGVFEMLGTPYVGSGVVGSAVGMDKVFMKKLFESSGIPQCKYLSFNKEEIIHNTNAICEQVEQNILYPCFIKPANAGSSIGITKATNREMLLDGLDYALKYDSKVLVEETVIGRELEIGILGNEEILTSAVGEVKTTNDFYDYEAKYKNQLITSIQIPAKIPNGVVERMSAIAKDVCKALNCYGLSRVDFFWIESTDKLVVNEINTIPGFTPFSMYPLLFNEIGISYSTLIERLIDLAFAKHNKKTSTLIN